MKGKWDEGSVEQDLPIIDDTKKILDGSEQISVMEKRGSLKEDIKRELESLGWIYQGGATFKANFPLRNKYLIFDFSFVKEGAQDIHRIKLVVDDNGVSDYKLMKWAPKY